MRQKAQPQLFSQLNRLWEDVVLNRERIRFS